MKYAKYLGDLFILALIVVSIRACVQPAHAEPGNAADVKGKFILVVGGTGTGFIPYGTPPFNDGKGDIQYRIQPFTIPGFTSFKLCVGAGRELQARLNSDGYILDFACVATGR